MKKLVILSIFISTISFGQFFKSEHSEYEEQYAQSSNEYEFFDGPDQGLTTIPDPHPGDTDDPVPINNYWLLMLVGFFIGGIYMSRTKPHSSKS